MNESPMKLNTSVYYLASSATSAAITLEDADISVSGNKTFVDLYNDSVYTAFVVSGETSPTAAFPTSATDPVVGTTIPAGGRATYEMDRSHKYIAVISAGAESGKGMHFKIGNGI